MSGDNGASATQAPGDGKKQGGGWSTGGEQASTSGRSEGGGGGVMTVYVAVDGKLAGVFEMRDQLRPDAAATIRGLQQEGIDTILLSGTGLPALLRHAALPVLCCAVLKLAAGTAYGSAAYLPVSAYQSICQHVDLFPSVVPAVARVS